MQSALKIVATMLLVIISGPARSAGFQYLTIPDDTGRPIELGIWYPSDARPAPSVLGHVAQTVAVGGEIKGEHLPLVVFSHGSEGCFCDRADSARMLADAGFVAVSLTHPGDNYKEVDRDALQILAARPRQVGSVLDYVTQSWPGHTRLDISRIGFYGFSAGGFTGLVLVGGVPDWTLFAPHCRDDPSEGVCKEGIAKRLSSAGAAMIPRSAWQQDARIKAAVLASPGFAFSFDPASLRSIGVPIELWGSNQDQVVPFASNAGYLQRYLPHITAAHDVADARHYSFLRPCSDAARAALPDICSDRPGFDREVFQNTLNKSLVQFFRTELQGE
jgi:predicted dienelactone hydrolase